jgi:hypothetical protein
MTLIMARRPGFEPGPDHVGFVSDKVSLERSFGHIRIVASTYQLGHVRQSVRRYQFLIVADDIYSPQQPLCATQYIYTVEGDV